MKVVFSVGAALRSEKIKTAKRINQCGSFIKLAIAAEGLENFRTDEGKSIVSFDCDEFEIVEGHSSKEWAKLFPHKQEGKCVVITLPDKYIIGPVIPGYH
jgi:hypothetical protein